MDQIPRNTGAPNLPFSNSRFIARNSFNCDWSGWGYSIFKSFKALTTTWEMMSRALSLSSAGTTYHGACLVLVAVRQSS